MKETRENKNKETGQQRSCSSHLNRGTEDMTKSKSTRKTEWYPPPVPSPTPKYKSTTHQQSHLPFICNNNTIEIALLVQMRQFNKCGSVRNGGIFNLHLGSGADPWVSIHCLLQDISHIYWFQPPKQSTRKNQRIQK